MGHETLPPGFRFSPTDEELVAYYLRSKALGKIYYQGNIADVDIYKLEPWDLPEKAAQPSKDQEWYFFSAQDKKYSHTARINRTTKKGYWKATGKDRKVYSGSSVIGLKKTLIYYEGRAPNGNRTNWIMHEYRLDEEFEKKQNVICGLVLCRIRKKHGPGPRNGEQYGAPVTTESIELDEEANMGKVDDGTDTGCWGAAEGRVSNAFNLRDQVESWKLPVQMGSSNVAADGPEIKENRLPKMEPDYEDLENVPISRLPKMEPDYEDLENVPIRSKGTTDCDLESNVIFQSISDATNDISPYYMYDHGGDTFPCHHLYTDMQNSSTLFDFETLPYVPTIMDANGHLFQDYIFPDFDEPEMLREISDLVNDGKNNVGSIGPNERVMLQAACNTPLGGDYIELDDMKAPLPLMPLVHSSERKRHEGQQLDFKADMKVERFEDSMHTQGLAPHRAQLQIPVSKGMPKAAAQAEMCFYGGDTSRPISMENYRNAGNRYVGCHSGPGDAPHVIESSTRSYLSKHVSSYAVSKHEMLPEQLCYASYADGHDCSVSMNNVAEPNTSLAIKGKCKIDADVLTKFPTSTIGLPSLSDSPTKSRRHMEAGTHAFENIPAVPINSSLSLGLPAKTSSARESRPDVRTYQACDLKSEHANTSSLNRHSWKKPFRGLVSKVKWSALASRIAEMENGLRAKFNNKLCALGKPAARVLPAIGSASPYDSLRQGIMATLYLLVAAVLIFLVLIWGSRALVRYAFSISV